MINNPRNARTRTHTHTQELKDKCICTTQKISTNQYQHKVDLFTIRALLCSDGDAAVVLAIGRLRL